MAELRTVGVIAIAVASAIIICMLILILFFILRYRYNKYRESHPTKDPRSHSKLFACYAYCCCLGKSKKKHKKKGLNQQISVSYQSEGISLGEDTQGVVIKNAEKYKDSSFTNAAFAESREINNGGSNSNSVETRSAGIAKDMKIVITPSDEEEDCEVRRNIPIRRSADAYSEIDLNSQYIEQNRKTETNEQEQRTKIKKARQWKGKK